MANLLEVGVEFESFDAFQAAMEQYEDSNFVQFVRIDSRSVEKAQETSLTKTYNPEIKFVQLTYSCTFGPRKGPSKSTGQRNANSRKIDCPVRIRASATPDGQRLVIRESLLDCHNHEISEEQYKSLSRQKQLDEETEMEIYNIVNSHEDKRIARMAIRDKLTKETGRTMTVKDILNIEKKISKKLGHDKNSGDDADAKDDDDEDDEADEENAEDEDAEGDDNDEDKEDSQDGEEGSSAKKPRKKMKTVTRSPGRPQRNRREPRRFRDALENGIKILHTSKDNVVSFISPEEAEEMESGSSSRRSPKVKDEPVERRGRKRKVQTQAENDSVAERKLAIKEELLEMEKKKMKILQDIVKKLDKIIENQKK